MSKFTPKIDQTDDGKEQPPGKGLPKDKTDKGKEKKPTKAKAKKDS